MTTPIPTAGLPIEFYLEGQPTAFVRSNLSRLAVQGNVASAGSGVMLSTAVYLNGGETVTSVVWYSGTTASGTPTNSWVALYDAATTPSAAPVLMAQSTDAGSAAIAANTKFTYTLATAQKITVPGIYYVGLMNAATTPCTYAGANLQNAATSTGALTGSKVLSRTSGSSLTTTAPATIASPTTVLGVPWVTLI